MNILESIFHPLEVLALVRYSREMSLNRRVYKCSFDDRNDTKQMCYYYLQKTSRSFAAVVQALDVELRDAVHCSFLLLDSS